MDIQSLVVAHISNRCRFTPLGASVEDRYYSDCNQITLSRPAWAVALGEDAAGVPLYCWVLLEDGKTLISFEDAATVERRIARAQEVFSLSPAQTRLARLIVDGHDLAVASGLLGVSINTLRTQLQRIFDKTGVRSQAALVRSLLSAEAPTK